MLVKTKGIVLRETPYSETSKVLNILTNDYGLIGIMAKGARNLKSKLRGVSSRMVYAEFTLNYKEKGLSILTEGAYLNSFKNIYADIKKANYSFYLMDLFYQVAMENNNKSLFPLLEQGLIKINDGLSPELISDIIEIKLLKYLGVSLELHCCSKCGQSTNLFNLDIMSGGVICRECYNDGYLFNAKTIRLMQVLEQVDLTKLSSLTITDENIFNELEMFLREYYETYTGLYLKDKRKLNRLMEL